MKTFEILASYDPYRSLPDKDKCLIFNKMKRYDHHPGDMLLSETQWVDTMGILVSGKAEVWMGINSDAQIHLYTLYPGDFFGTLACLTDRKSLVSVVCKEGVVTCQQKYEEFMNLMEENIVLKCYFSNSALKKLWHIFKVVRDGGMTDLPETRIPKPVKKSLQFIDTNFDQPLTIGQVSLVAGMSKSTFSRRFKQHLGVSFKTYLNHLRVSKAKQFIASDGMNVTEACFAAGFNDTAYFSRTFRKIEGKSPSQLKSA